MANRNEARRSEIDLSLEVHDLTTKLNEEKQNQSTSGASIKDRDYFKTLVHEVLKEELEVDPEVHEIFQEDQYRVLVDRSTITGVNVSYQLLDDGFAPKNSLCHPEAHEDPYDEESRP